MNALELNKVMDLSIEYRMGDAILKRNVKAGRTDSYGKNWLLIETVDENSEVNTQWIEISFFQQWLSLIGSAA